MEKVVGIGAVLFKCIDPDVTRKWYKKHLNIGNTAHGHTFSWPTEDKQGGTSTIEWCPFKADTDYFSPSKVDYMINFRVANLDYLLNCLKQEGIVPVGNVEDTEYGRFAWIMDPDGRKIELWEPIE
jgi:hypothetical protein